MPKRFDMKSSPYVCPYCQKVIKDESLGLRICEFCNQNLSDRNALLRAKLTQSWWFKVLAILGALTLLSQLIIWAWNSRAFRYSLALIFLVSMGVYWLNKTQKAVQK